MSFDSTSSESAGYHGGSSGEGSGHSSSLQNRNQRRRSSQLRQRGGQSPELSSGSPSPTRQDDNIYTQPLDRPPDCKDNTTGYKPFPGLAPSSDHLKAKWSSSSDSEHNRPISGCPVEETGRAPKKGRKRPETKENLPVTKRRKSRAPCKTRAPLQARNVQ